MAKKIVYHISGFDCPNCAAKLEHSLNKCEDFQEVAIDFANERMYVTYVNEPYTNEQLINLVKQYNDDPLRIERINKGKAEKTKLFGKDFWITFSRILISTIIIVITRIIFKEEFSWIAFGLYSVALIVVLYDIFWKIISNIIHKRNPIDMYLLLTISSVGVFALSVMNKFKVFGDAKESVPIDMLDGVLVVILYQVGELFEGIATGKSKRAISEAIDLRADTANLVTDNKIVEVKPETLKVGDTIIVRIGEIIPADGEVIDGQGTLDMSSLTGEPMPVDALVGMNALSGSILRSGSLTIKVNKVFADSTISKILDLVQSSGERKAKAEKFITRFARIYTPSVFIIGILFSVIFGLITKQWPDAIFRGLSILVVACPCAIVISVPLAYFAGIGLASKRGIVVKGANYLDSLCKIGTVFLDKTGTLTYGNFEMTDITPFGISKEQFMTYLLAAESRSNHPIAKAIVLHNNVSELALKQEQYEEIAGLGTKTVYEGHTILAGNAELLLNNNVKLEEIEVPGTIVYVSCDQKYIGYIVLKDVVRDKAKQLIKKLDLLGIKTVLLSGDKLSTVEDVASQVGIKEYHAKLLPQDKTKFVEEAINNRKDGKLIAFAGDGINDTPSIIRADVGFAMGGIGSDVAVENSDVVIMQDHPLKIYDSIRIAKMTKVVAIFNIIFSLFVKLGVIVLLMVGVVKNIEIAVFADTGLTVLMTLNSLLLIYRKVK